ncbi:hypothetical protein G6F37_010782 [Rhizopus arrhizus]|nr:hypothetical protein G6F38_010520 [Rhizopus arrhizus]KAG1152516.1 hypothetical protein G6F37_010782 [Rhizopus arrhizus]
MCALSVAVPVLSALFMKFRSLSTKWFEIQTNFTNRHLFDGVIFYDGILEPMALAEFGGAKCTDDKVNGDTLKVYRNALRILNEISAKTKKGETPKVFIVLFHKAILRFETLALLDNCMYVRTRHAKIRSPRTPEELKLFFPELRKAISWRDALVQNVDHLHIDSSEGSSPDCTYETSSVCSTP